MRDYFVNQHSGNSGKSIQRLSEITRKIAIDAFREWAAHSPNRSGYELFPPVVVSSRGVPFGRITSLVNSMGSPVLINEGGNEVSIQALNRNELIEITRRIDGTCGGCREVGAKSL